MYDCLSAAGPLHGDAPLHMVWISTNACNARCQHCSSNSTRRTADELTTSEVLGLVDELASFGVLDLAVSGGEPLLRKDLTEVVSHATRRGIAVGVGSNGGKLNERQAEGLREAGVGRVQFSLDGFAGAHDSLRRWPGLFDRVVSTIALALGSGLRVHVCCTVNRLNEDELEPFAEFVSSLGISRLNFSRYVPTGRGTDVLDLDLIQWRRVMERCSEMRARFRGTMEIVGHLAQEVLLDPSLAEVPVFAGCQAGRGQGCVTANGTVFPCVLLPVPLGNIRERPFRENWRDSPVLDALRNRDRLEGKCRTCFVRERCGGCRAVAYAKTGSYMAPDPRCWL